MKVVGQVSGFTCPRVVSRTLTSSSSLKQHGLLSTGCPPLLRMDSSARLARLSHVVGSSSSFCILHDSPFNKSGKKYSTSLGKLWCRRMFEGRIRCELAGASSSQEDEIGPDETVQSALGGNETVQFDLDLPRRSLLLEFTCNVCQARTQRMINPEALRRGTVYVQCGGCQAYHQLVDNLNLVEEHNFEEDELLHLTSVPQLLVALLLLSRISAATQCSNFTKTCGKLQFEIFISNLSKSLTNVRIYKFKVTMIPIVRKAIPTPASAVAVSL